MIYYFDNCATTRVDDEYIDIINKYNTSLYFNPSAMYQLSVSIKADIESARKLIANKLGCNADQIIFTSCGTESINTAINSCVKSNKGDIISTSAEHSAVYNTLNKFNQQLKIAPTNIDGTIKLDCLLSMINNNTVLVVLTHVNSQTGGINDISAISKAIRQINKNVPIVVDGVQAVGKIPVNLNSMDIDFYCISGHKINAPKGIGLLYVRAKHLSPLLFGGGQENNLRSGTENVSGTIVLSQAITTAVDNIKSLTAIYNSYTKDILATLDANNIDYLKIAELSSPHMLCICLANIRGEIIQHILETDNIIIGTGSACTSKNKLNRVINSLNLPVKYQQGLIRISYSKYNDNSQVQFLNLKLIEAITKLNHKK